MYTHCAEEDVSATAAVEPHVESRNALNFACPLVHVKFTEVPGRPGKQEPEEDVEFNGTTVCGGRHKLEAAEQHAHAHPPSTRVLTISGPVQSEVPML